MATKLAAKRTKNTGVKKIDDRPIKAKAKALKSAKPLQAKAKTAKTTAAKITPKAARSAQLLAKKVATPSSDPGMKANKTKMKARPTKVAHRASAKPAADKPVAAPKPKPLAGAILAFETGIKAMYAENYEKAIKSFNELIAAYPEEPEIQASAKARIHTCEMKLHEQARSVFRSADDHYNIAVALMNRRELDSAFTHLQHALKLAPKGDHILYAMAVANALRGNKDQALSYLKQSIHHRPENRFQAAKDNDFAVLIDEPGFRELLTASEK